MALMQRKKGSPANKSTHAGLFGDGTHSNGESSKSKNKRFSISQLVTSFISILSLATGGLFLAKGQSSDLDWIDNAKEGVKVGIHWKENVRVDKVLKIRGPHGINIITSCPKLVPYVFISGDVLQTVKLLEKTPMKWSGEFTLPMTGKFELKMMGPGCKDGEQIDLKIREFEVTDSSSDPSSEYNSISKSFTKDMIAKGAWIKSSNLKINTSSEQQTPSYVWMNPDLKKKQVESIDKSDNFVVKEGSVTEKYGFYEFRKLSNYELVCFFGSQSAKDLHESLLSLRGHLFAHQRPFKFHYYEVNNLIHPDHTWDKGIQERFRKCKHILVSIDEPEIPLSQNDYKKQITTLVTHLTRAFDDETFPIWLLSTMESPNNTKNCFNGHGLRSTEHPCNVVLKKLFQHSPFTERVRFLDNTDVSLTLPAGNTLFKDLQKDVFGVVALRIFIIVGYQVKVWRDNKQLGHINGLTKGDVEYPNFELVPYNFNQIISR